MIIVPLAIAYGRRIKVIDAITRQIGRVRPTRGRRSTRLRIDLNVYCIEWNVKNCVEIQI